MRGPYSTENRMPRELKIYGGVWCEVGGRPTTDMMRFLLCRRRHSKSQRPAAFVRAETSRFGTISWLIYCFCFVLVRFILYCFYFLLNFISFFSNRVCHDYNFCLFLSFFITDFKKKEFSIVTVFISFLFVISEVSTELTNFDDSFFIGKNVLQLMNFDASLVRLGV